MKTVLITGGAARIGAQIARTLHENNFKIIIHCNQSLEKAQLLSDELNSIIKDSSEVIGNQMMRLHQFNPKNTGLSRKALEMSLTDLVDMGDTSHRSGVGGQS